MIGYTIGIGLRIALFFLWGILGLALATTLQALITVPMIGTVLIRRKLESPPLSDRANEN
jgi:hypothetical protein